MAFCPTLQLMHSTPYSKPSKKLQNQPIIILKSPLTLPIPKHKRNNRLQKTPTNNPKSSLIQAAPNNLLNSIKNRIATNMSNKIIHIKDKIRNTQEDGRYNEISNVIIE